MTRASAHASSSVSSRSRRFVRTTASSFLGPLVGVLPGAACWGDLPAGKLRVLTATDGAAAGGNRA